MTHELCALVQTENPIKANTVEWSNGVNTNSNVQIADTSSKSKLGKSFAKPIFGDIISYG